MHDMQNTNAKYMIFIIQCNLDNVALVKIYVSLIVEIYSIFTQNKHFFLFYFMLSLMINFI